MVFGRDGWTCDFMVFSIVVCVISGGEVKWGRLVQRPHMHTFQQSTPGGGDKQRAYFSDYSAHVLKVSHSIFDHFSIYWTDWPLWGPLGGGGLFPTIFRGIFLHCREFLVILRLFTPFLSMMGHVCAILDHSPPLLAIFGSNHERNWPGNGQKEISPTWLENG